jgi:vancomycin permeability regulator SanA
MSLRRRRIWTAIGALAVLAGLAIAGPTGYSLAAADGRVGSVTGIPKKPVAIVFGAAVYASGEPLPYLKARLDLAYDLYAAKKVEAILVSGDNRRADYNEPDAMRAYLIDRGVPAAKIVADYAGFDTYDTCVRAHRIFGVTEAILTSQSYHLPRAIATCRATGVDAWGVGDTAVVSYTGEWWQDSLREWPANIKMASDLITRPDPVLGQPESSLTEALQP